ncbi:hypothetical protein [Streptobacillus moniliformis]|uniref:hypothetical protein n=1 Tax=Streptobacillus moniliformis TaxID=34105 RepID=UPI000A913E3D|nr:hypothetical protein [Streptobacillus moniliformis]
MIDIIDTDKTIQFLDEETQNLYSSYFKFDYNDKPFYFDYEQEKVDKEKMLSVLEKLIARLNEINDGSLYIDDQETERLRNL